MYETEFSREALKALKAMPCGLSALILEKIGQLAADPLSALNVKKLTGRSGYRLRVGDWRVIHELVPRQSGKDVAPTIHVLLVAPRGGVYQ
jgi:mRNA interferase RelE/StbE